MSSELLSIPIKRADGQQTTLGEYQNDVILVVNVASKCGLTVQYESLEKLFESTRHRGLVVVGFPANDFNGQEPGTDEEIQSFCRLTYDVKFPIFAKISVTGKDKHPLYDRLSAAGLPTIGDGAVRDDLKKHGIRAENENDVVWNFEKFLIGRNGNVAARFAPNVTVEDPRFLAELEKALLA